MPLGNQPFVVGRISGQMGNQMFQLATTMAYGWDFNAIPYFPDLNKQEDRISYNRNRIFFRFNSLPPPRPILNVFTESNAYSARRIPFRIDQQICGCFQSWKHFDHHRDKILPLLAPSQKVINTLHAKYGVLIAKPNTVAVHVRTQNRRVHNEKLHPFLGFKYFQNALDLFPNHEFIVFSDRINWCKVNFPKKLNKKFIFIESNDGVDDFFLMTMMKNIILSNSTYSWWAAYMNLNREKLIVAPYSFVDPRPDPRYPVKNSYVFNKKEFFFPEWHLITDIDFNEPYPHDMEIYDVHSQSLSCG
jgi:hypothetical protein